MVTVQDWPAEAIRDAVHAAGKTLRGLARSQGLHPLACQHALTRRHQSGEQAIAACIGVALHELWPDRWSADGRRIDHRFLPPKVTPLTVSGTRQKRAAA